MRKLLGTIALVGIAVVIYQQYEKAQAKSETVKLR
jgi:hypothetical protein